VFVELNLTIATLGVGLVELNLTIATLGVALAELNSIWGRGWAGNGVGFPNRIAEESAALQARATTRGLQVLAVAGAPRALRSARTGRGGFDDFRVQRGECGDGRHLLNARVQSGGSFGQESRSLPAPRHCSAAHRGGIEPS
jgi:hypothetical protein